MGVYGYYQALEFVYLRLIYKIECNKIPFTTSHIWPGYVFFQIPIHKWMHFEEMIVILFVFELEERRMRFYLWSLHIIKTVKSLQNSTRSISGDI